MGGTTSDSSVTDVKASWLEDLYRKLPIEDTRELGMKYISIFSQLIKGQYIVTSIGEQSLGKSYFLNEIFGTNFTAKRSTSQGKCTMNMNLSTDKGFNLIDFEGFDSDENTVKRDNSNISFALAFSHVTLIHLDQRKIHSRFIDRFSFAFWLAIKKMKFNQLKLPKIILLIRNPEIDEELDDCEKMIERFTKSVNEKLNSYNEELRKIIMKGIKETNKQEVLNRIIPDDECYRFKHDGFQLIFWDTVQKKYLGRKNNTLVDFDKSNFFELIHENLLNKTDGLSANNKSITQCKLLNSEQLKESFKLLEKKLPKISKKFQCLKYYILGIELDFHYECLDFNQLSIIIETLQNIISIFQQEKKTILKVSSPNLINIQEEKKKNLNSLGKEFSKIIQNDDIKLKIIHYLITGSANEYSKYLGIFFINELIKHKKIENFKYFSSDQLLKITEKNFIFSVLEIILKYNNEDYNELLENEFNKIRIIRNYFKSLCYFEKTDAFYKESLEKSFIDNFYVVIFSLVMERFEKIFDAEINWKDHYLDISETINKIKYFRWSVWCVKIEELIKILELPNLSDFQEFFNKLKIFFNNYIKDLILHAKEKYKIASERKTILIERSHFLKQENIEISRVPVKISYYSGHSIPPVGGLLLGFSEYFGLTTFIEIDEVGAAGLGLRAFIGNLVFSQFLIRWGMKKIFVLTDNELDYEDVFEVGNNIEKDVKIINVTDKNSLRNFEFGDNYPQYTVSPNTLRIKNHVKLSDKSLLSGVIYSQYFINLKKNRISELNPDQIESTIQELLSISLLSN